MKWLALVAVLAACKGREAEPSGVGPYVFGHTTWGSIHEGNCQPTVLEDGRKAIWCMGLPPFKVGTKTAEVNTYFNGTDKTAPLIELQLHVRGCIEDEVDRWMRERFGPPYETKSTREYWKNSFLWASAELPTEPARCVIHFLPITETSEIERIRKK